MTWDAFHRRGEVLRAVVEQADARRDGILPMEVPGVVETFGDELALLGALQLRWHTRLAGMIERELMDQPMNLEAVVVRAWRKAATELAGIRIVLDRYTEAPTSPAVDEMLTRAQWKDWTLMAAMAGKAGPVDPGAAAVGRAIEGDARAGYRPTVGGRHRSGDTAKASLLGRIKACVAA